MAATVSDQLVSIIRTAVPAVIGAVVAFAATHGMNLDPTMAVSLITPLVITVYYTLVRKVEDKYPQAGWLLGYPASPSYSPPAPPAA